MEKYRGTRQATDNNVAHALCTLITKATDTHSEYEILVTFPRQQSVGECAALLRSVYYITAFVNTKHMSLSASLVLIVRKCVYQQLPYTQTAVLQSDSKKD